jgi:radical SAM protein with 4Fe4S-binding SPASM domain
MVQRRDQLRSKFPDQLVDTLSPMPEPEGSGQGKPERYDAHRFLAHRRRQEAQHIASVLGDQDPLNSLLQVELNSTELCNRTCWFCPRSNAEIYPNRNLNMSPGLAEKVANDLSSFGYRGRISLSGFGEPLLNKNLAELICALRSHLPKNTIDTNSNGDRLSVEQIAALFEAGITFIYVNLYDSSDQEEPIRKRFEKAGIPEERFKIRPHWDSQEEDWGLILNNRSGMIVDPEHGLEVPKEPIERPCYYPFSRLLIDWNGDVPLCSNDWGRKRIVGNVGFESVRDIWMSEEITEARKELMRSDRRSAPCSKCSVNGILTGAYSFDLIADHYREIDDLDDETWAAVQSHRENRG